LKKTRNHWGSHVFLVGEDIQRQLGLTAKETQSLVAHPRLCCPQATRFSIKTNYIKNQPLILFKKI